MTDDALRKPRPGPLGRLAIAMFSPAVILLALVTIAVRATGLSYGFFMRDPAATMRMPLYLGLVSNLGILVWCAGGVIALFAAALLPRGHRHSEWKRFLFWSGILTIYLMLDDFFLIHERVFGEVLRLREQVPYILYVASAVAYIYRFRRLLLAYEPGLLLLAAALAGLSLVLDQWPMFSVVFGRAVVPKSCFLEDGAKLLSMVTWMAYLTRRSADAVSAAMQPAEQPVDSAS